MRKARYGTGGGPRMSVGTMPSPPREEHIPKYSFEPTKRTWVVSVDDTPPTPALPVEAAPVPTAYRPPRLPRSTRRERLEEISPLFRPFITVRGEDR